MSLKIYNSLTKSKDKFEPLESGHVKIYNCGITPNKPPHLGHGSAALRMTMVRRYLLYKGFKVTYVQNVTDIDDKVIEQAAELNINPLDLSRKLTKIYNDELTRLGIESPDHGPLVSEYIQPIISYIEKLIEKDFAYKTDVGNVYFKVSKFSDYGKLSGRNIEEQVAGTRVNIKDDKVDEEDFALWKSDRTEGASWNSPWGFGRPGWHIECSVMANKILGPTIDIHAGGQDLVFPHHENEIAQCEAHNDCLFSRFWMHVGLLTVDGVKMSKSLNNFITLKDGIDKYGSTLIKFVLFKHHYRSPFDAKDKLFHENLNNVCEFYENVETLEQVKEEQESNCLIAIKMKENFEKFMDADFNSPCALIELISGVDEAIKSNNKSRFIEVAKTARKLGGVLGVLGLSENSLQIREECLKFQCKYMNKDEITCSDIETLVEERLEARKVKDFKESDAIRDNLLLQGITLLDDKLGNTRWIFSTALN